MACKENQSVKQINDLYDQILKLESLKPSKEVDKLFEQLMITCMSTDTKFDIQKMSQEVKDMSFNLIKLRGVAVGYLEEQFSTKLGSLKEDENPLHHIDLFPTYNKYVNLSKTEFDLITQHTTHVPNKIAFVGSGPMPLTSIILAKSHLPNTTFHNFDIDAQANALASRLVSQDVDLSRRMVFHTMDLMDMTKETLRGYDVVFLAALVGLDREAKLKAIEHLEKHMAPGGLLMLRSSHGLRAFLFHTIDPFDLKGFEVLTTYHPMTDAFMNSVVVARKLSGQITNGN